MQQPKRVAAIHDLSGFGRCSLAVIIPILSVMKKQVCPIPTTILSSHTGGLLEPVIRDLPGFVAQTLIHYQQLNLEFDCIYSGYLGDAKHVDDCFDFMQAYPAALKVVDPVMGDHGKPYKHVTAQRIKRMKELVHEADLITPNMTEVYLLLEEQYSCLPRDLLDYRTLLQRLSQLGPTQIVVTGAPLSNGHIMNLGYDSNIDTFYAIPCYYNPISYPGTGDIFASLLIGSLLDEHSLPESIEIATRFLEYVIKESSKLGADPRYGVILEPYLGWLLQTNLAYEYFLF